MNFSLRVCLFLAALPAAAQSFTVETLLGPALNRDGSAALSARFASIDGLAADAAGRIYIADATAHRVWRVNVDGTITTVAGTGAPGDSGDGGPASSATLSAPYGIAVDGGGSVYIADFGNARIRRVDPGGTIRAVTTSARFTGPRNIAAASSGDLYVSDYSAHRVWRIAPGGAAAVIAGAGSQVTLSAPAGVAADGLGGVYIADSGNKRILRAAGGATSVVLDNQSAEAGAGTPVAVSVDAFGTLLAVDTAGNRLIQRTASGVVTVLAAADLGIETIAEAALSPRGQAYVASRLGVWKLAAGSAPEAVAGGGADATALEGPIGVAVDTAGTIFVAEEAARRIRKLAPDGTIGIAGEGSLLTDPVSVAWDPAFGIRAADFQSNRIVGVTSAGDLYTVSGDGEPGLSGDGDFAAKARWNKPRAVAFDAAGNLYVADSANHRVRRIAVDGRVSTIAGTGTAGFAPSGGLAIRSPLDTPAAVAIGPGGDIFIADAGNHAVAAVSPAGIFTRIAGTGTAGDSGDGGPATRAQLRFPAGLAVDAAGAVYLADTFNHRVRRVAPDGTIVTVAGNGKPGLAGDGGDAKLSQWNTPTGVAIDATGRLYVADLENHRVRRLTPAAQTPPTVTPAEPPGNPAPSTPAPPALTEAVVRNAASLAAGPVAPGMVVTVDAPASAEIRIDGKAAPRLATRDGQVDVQAPYAAAPGSTVTFEVWRLGVPAAERKVAVAAASPGVYTASGGAGQAAILHGDGSRNSTDNPAVRGSVVSLFVTGAGMLTPTPADGTGARDPLPTPVLPVAVRVGSSDCEVIWAGAAPGLAGVVQVNARMPGLFTAPGVRRLKVAIGGAESQDGVTIVLK
ncbi:MAG: hypothetical protein R2729_10285 [Bryobacteraceae bacterium]